MRQLTGGKRDTIYTPAVLMLVILVGISFLGLGLVMPLRALYGRQIGASSTEIGLMTASFALPIIFIAPLAGRITDRYGRYWFFLLGLLVTGGTFCLYSLPFVTAWAIVFISLLEGAGAAVVRSALVAQFITPEIAPEEGAIKR